MPTLPAPTTATSTRSIPQDWIQNGIQSQPGTDHVYVRNVVCPRLKENVVCPRLKVAWAPAPGRRTSEQLDALAVDAAAQLPPARLEHEALADHLALDRHRRAA